LPYTAAQEVRKRRNYPRGLGIGPRVHRNVYGLNGAQFKASRGEGCTVRESIRTNTSDISHVIWCEVYPVCRTKTPTHSARLNSPPVLFF
jgi:hypothetical protein